MLELVLADESETRELGARLAEVYTGGGQIYLQGELGAGKTTLVRGFLQALGYEGLVKSPTYTLVEPYELAGRTLYHLDLYRLGEPEELEWIGFRDLLSESSLCLIEWPEQGGGFLTPPDLEISLDYYAGSGRRARIIAQTVRGNDQLDKLAATESSAGY